MAQYRFLNGKPVVEQPQEDASEPVIDLTQEEVEEEERPRKIPRRNDTETTSTSPARASSSQQPTPDPTPTKAKRSKSTSTEPTSRAIPAEAKRKVAMAILCHGVDGINRAKLSAETGLSLQQIHQLVRKEGTV